jgi:hypothetical protein
MKNLCLNMNQICYYICKIYYFGANILFTVEGNVLFKDFVSCYDYVTSVLDK